MWNLVILLSVITVATNAASISTFNQKTRSDDEDTFKSEDDTNPPITIPRKPKAEFVPILKSEAFKEPNGSYRFEYESGDRSARQESGVFENKGEENGTLEITGSYKYIDSNGHEVIVSYTAGKNGFVPYGSHIPSEISALAEAAATLPTIIEENLKKIKKFSQKEQNTLNAV